MEKIRNYIFAGFFGLLIGAGIVSGCWLYHAGRNTAANRAILTAYQSTLADWQRRAAELDEELGSIKSDARQSAELSRQLTATFAEHFTNITKARSENERAIAQLRLAITIFNVLRSYYDPGYHQSAESDQPPKF